MIPFFVGYAVVMCTLSYRGRRRWSGLVALFIGSLILVALGVLHAILSRTGNIPSAIVVVGIIYYPYILMVVLISVWFVLLPRERKIRGRCGRCGYDIQSLSGRTDRCPECGDELVPKTHSSHEIAEYQRLKWNPQAKPHAAFLAPEPATHAAEEPPAQSDHRAEQKHPHGHPENQPPAEPAEY